VTDAATKAAGATKGARPARGEKAGKTGASFTVRFKPSGRKVRAGAGVSLLDAAAAAGVDIDAPCGGQGRCGRCKVKVRSGDAERRPSAHLRAEEIADGVALACQTFVTGDVDIVVHKRALGKVRPTGHAAAQPESLPVSCDWRRNPAVRTFVVELDPPSLLDNTSDIDRLRRELGRQHDIDEVRAELTILGKLSHTLREADWKVAVTLEMRDWIYGTYLPPRLIDVRPATDRQGSYGLAIDVGTTSVVAYLVDFHTAAVFDTASAYNRQIECGEDVISRIIFSQRGAGLLRLQRLVLETINELIAELRQRTGVAQREIHEVAVAGNTTMTHLLLGLDPKYLREEPYIPTVSRAPKLVAGELGLHVNAQARVHCLPSVGSYVGGDITAGVISSGLYASDRLTLFIDIGTNGEMVLGTGDWLIACACSAGPAFEGGGVGHGMRASSGAIEDVWVNASSFEPTFRTVDNAPPLGICGSGLIDLLGELFVTGVIDKSGHIDLSLETPRVREGQRGPEYVVAWEPDTGIGHDITITDTDIDNLLRAKAAIYAGYSVLCRSVGVDLDEVEQILIGGAFGQYVNVEKAIRIGLLPDLPPERFHFLGNTSALGAYTTLLCVNSRHDVLDVAGKMTYLELSADNSFMDEYMSALFLPHTHLEYFPTVKALLDAANTGSRKDTAADHTDRRDKKR
jgi:uncharacterized 2Fe-2S/4Fe-4S cluster protein (DUF4445 family)